MPKSAREDGLNDQMKLFVAHYVANDCSSATKAVIAAGYSEKGASVTGSRLLANIKVREAINAELKRITKDLDLLRVKWLKRQEELLDSDITDVQSFTNEGGVIIKDSSTLPRSVTRTIQSVKSVVYEGVQGRTVTTEVRMRPTDGAHDRLGKFMRLYGDVNEPPADDSTRLSGEARAARIVELLAKRDAENKEAKKE